MEKEMECTSGIVISKKPPDWPFIYQKQNKTGKGCGGEIIKTKAKQRILYSDVGG